MEPVNDYSCEAIIVSYHSASVLAPCLRSLAQFMGEGRITLVDNAAGDGSAEEAQAVVPGINIIRSPGNIGFGAAVNSAMRASDADVFLLINPDCRILEGNLSEVLRRFREHPRVAAISTRLVDEDGETSRNCKSNPGPFDYLLYRVSADKRFPGWRYPREMRLADMDYDVEQAVPSLSGAFMFIHRRAVEDVGFLDERFFMYCEETDWCTRAAARGWECMYTPVVTVEHDGGSSDVAVSRLTRVMLESQLKYIRKHHGLPAAAAHYAGSLTLDLVRVVRGIVSPGEGRMTTRDFAAHLPAYLGQSYRRTAMQGEQS